MSAALDVRRGDLLRRYFALAYAFNVPWATENPPSHEQMEEAFIAGNLDLFPKIEAGPLTILFYGSYLRIVCEFPSRFANTPATIDYGHGKPRLSIPRAYFTHTEDGELLSACAQLRRAAEALGVELIREADTGKAPTPLSAMRGKKFSL